MFRFSILVVTFCLISTWCVAQSSFTLTLIDASTGQPAVNQFASFVIYPSNGTPPTAATQEGVTNQNGSISFGPVAATGNYTMVSVSYDCNNQYVIDTISQDLSINPTMVDTLTLACMPAGGLNCETGINFEPDTLNPLTVHITLDTTLYSGAPPSHTFFPGDWTIAQEYPHFVIDSLYSPGSIKISYTFPAPGTYSIGNLSTIWDSTLMETRPCFMETFDTITVPYTKYCKAGFLLDTNASNSDLLFVINTSTPNSSHYANSYFWDFGDGNTSNLPLPTHFYTAPGAYELCVTLTSVDPFQNTCTNTFCDTIGVDSTGQVIYKNMSKGFTLQVIDSSSIGIGELGHQPLFTLFPNPTSGMINLSPSNYLEDEASFVVYDLYGRELLSKKVKIGSDADLITLDVSALPVGMYIIKDDSGYSALFEVKY